MKSLNQNSQDIQIKLLTDKLNKLRIKQAMWNNGGYETPEYILHSIKLIEEELKKK